MSDDNYGPEPLEWFFEQAKRCEFGDISGYPEERHIAIDALSEAVVSLIVMSVPYARQAAIEVQRLLDIEKDQDWKRWYA